MDFDWHSIMMGELPDTNVRQGQSSSLLVPIQNNQQQSIDLSQKVGVTSTLNQSQQQPRLTRPSSASTIPSLASSPGTNRNYSSPLQQSRMSSKRSKSRKTEMDGESLDAYRYDEGRESDSSYPLLVRLTVKVLYTLDSHPNSTLVANLGRPAKVQIVSLGKKDTKGKSHALFGKVTLKTCLNAICMAR
jgi:hypothetical protein